MKDLVFGNRLRALRKRQKLTQEEAAIAIGVKYRTYQNHESGQWPNRTTQERYIDYFGCNEAWFKTGKGAPFPESREGDLYNKDREDSEGSHVSQPRMSYKAKEMRDEPFKIADALSMAIRVLESDTSYALALFTNIQHFDRAIQAEARISLLESQNRELIREIAGLKNRIELLEEEREERLKRGVAA